MKIKICGMRRPEDIEYANEVRPDYIGFILSSGYRRSVDAGMAGRLKAGLSKDIKAVGVFVDEDPEYIAGFIRQGIIDMVQLHGSESNGYVLHLKEMTGVPVIKMFKAVSGEAVDEAYRSHADYILFDSGAGTGRTFDWDIIKGFERDYFVAGGITPDNIRELVRRLSPYGVDLSSGVETDGVKDLEKMKRAVEERKMK